MIREILLIILVIEYIVIDAGTTWVGLHMFGGISEQNPFMRMAFARFSAITPVLYISSLVSFFAIMSLYMLSSDQIPFNWVALGVMIGMALVGIVLCVNNLMVLHKSLF